jgi:hypothetical protein
VLLLARDRAGLRSAFTCLAEVGNADDLPSNRQLAGFETSSDKALVNVQAILAPRKNEKNVKTASLVRHTRPRSPGEQAAHTLFRDVISLERI